MNNDIPTTIEELQEAFVQAHELWRRSPGSGRWPFAGDGPWHLVQGEAGDYGGDGVDGVASSTAPRVPLDAGEVSRRDRITAWLGMVEPERMRRVIHLATLQLYRDEGRPPWKAIAGWAGWEKTPDALALAYRRALAQLLCRLHRIPVRHARLLLKNAGLIEAPKGRPAMIVTLGDAEAAE